LFDHNENFDNVKCVVDSEAGLQFSGLLLKSDRQARLHPTLLVAQKKVFIKTILRCALRPLVLFILPFEYLNLLLSRHKKLNKEQPMYKKRSGYVWLR